MARDFVLIFMESIPSLIISHKIGVAFLNIKVVPFYPFFKMMKTVASLIKTKKNGIIQYLEMFRYFWDTLCIRTKACFLLGSVHRPVISNDAEQDRSTMLPVKAKAV